MCAPPLSRSMVRMLMVVCVVAHELRNTPDSKCTAHLFMYVFSPSGSQPDSPPLRPVAPDGSTPATAPERRRNRPARGRRSRRSGTCSTSSRRGSSTSCVRTMMFLPYVHSCVCKCGVADLCIGAGTRQVEDRVVRRGYIGRSPRAQPMASGMYVPPPTLLHAVTTP